MNYEGEKFLLKLYHDLDKQEGVLIAEKRSGKNSGNKYELLEKYLKRLESQEKIFDGEHQEMEKFLKNRYYDKYVINEDDIPDSYWELQKKIALERGYGHLEYTDELKHKEALTIIENQKKSLDKWLNYLMKENTSYPMWTRYWAFQGMLKLGKYDKGKHSFSKRSKGTVSPFVELNAEALAHTIRTVQSYYEGQDIKDDEFKQLVENSNFGKIYSYNIWKLIEEEKKNNKDKLDTDDGVWKIFTEGQEKELVKLLEGKGTGWCIAEEETAKDYLEKGKMHIYFTKDKKGKYTIPRVCIRQEYGEIAEVRGIAEDQNMEGEMLDITDKKLDEFEDKELYKKKVRDMKLLTKVYNKFNNNQTLSSDDLKFIYGPIDGFGWEEDPRVLEICKEYPIDNRYILLGMIAKGQGEKALVCASEKLKNDKKLVLEAVENDPYALQYASEKLRNDKEVVLKAVQVDPYALQYANENLKNDREFVLEATVENDTPGVFNYASDELKNDREYILDIVKVRADVLDFVSKELRNDREFMLEAIKNNANALIFASNEMRNDSQLVLEVVKRDPDVIYYCVGEELQNDKSFFLEAIKNNSGAWGEAFWYLQDIDSKLLKDKCFMLEAIKNNEYAIQYASDELRNDEEVILETIKSCSWALDWASDELKNNKEFVLEVVKQNPDTLEYIGEELQKDEVFMSKVRKLYDEYHNDIDDAKER